MSKIIFDIETVGVDFESLDQASQEYFLKFAKDEEEKVIAKESMGFYPLTARIVAIAMLECETDKGVVFYEAQAPGKSMKKDSIEYVPSSEKEILENFWRKIQGCNQFITFNGRSFDCPFILVRSGILKIKPTRELMPYRYDTKVHVDLMDQLTFYGAMRRYFSLHMWCNAFGIKSPKAEGVTGYEVKDLFEQGKRMEIAEYCMRDVQATKELYLAWERYMRPGGF